MSKVQIHIVGSGLAGSEAAYFLAERGIKVCIHEMRPKKMTEAHQSDQCAELVCSNSLKSKNPISGPGMLKAEMNHVGSLILQCAEASQVPGGEALTVDRDIFAQQVTQKLESHPNIERRLGEEITEPFEDAPTLFATGPLTSEGLSQWIASQTDTDDLYFYDAIAPIIESDSIDPEYSFLANRYGKGEEVAYLNCPMNKEEYEKFIDELLMGEKVTPKTFEKEKFFQGCQPIEAIAASGRESLRFGPMKPVGLENPNRPEEKAYAVVQLRPENKSRTAYNMVGFQTKLKYGEQKRIFKMIPALRNAEFLRLGSIHRNTYVCGPKVFRPDLSLKGAPSVYLAGQITGVEGYLESAGCGMLVAMFILQRIKGIEHDAPPPNTALGAMLHYLIHSDSKNYQPTNVHFGLFDPLYFDGLSGQKRKAVREKMAQQSLINFKKWWSSTKIPVTSSQLQELKKHALSL
ncbi:MAG: methylenetetrahydrofolate--tRNA-(uracil(54)-C(5))-methyltransferase (FADH(2)-oxidizing) TrmFO [Bdellovibrionaceae bacterium]|nr:methylenetetrahydrofolate--tRNA-(uracil(54)-C(5))-methyltransferase (FADH(2)-oxidizing) TrmFO [Pseudobdellovibrionaceae bacterium]